jgi:hypothetical protein
MTSSPLEFRATNLDCLLALVIPFGLPVACGLLYPLTGAIVPLVLYYGLCCIGVVKWRRGTLEYRRPKTWALPVFLTMIAMQLIQQIIGLVLIQRVPRSDTVGVFISLIVWAPLNALMEQLSWIYCYDAFAQRFTKKNQIIIGNIIGIALMLSLVGLIHVLFWAKFTPAYSTTSSYFLVFTVLQFATTSLYIVLYRKVQSMVPLALVHIISDAGLVLVPGFSILPHLLH